MSNGPDNFRPWRPKKTAPKGRWIQIKGPGWTCKRAWIDDNRTKFEGVEISGPANVSHGTFTEWRELP